MKLMIDLDGTMYHGTKIIESAHDFMKEAQRRNIDILFLTNNASRTQKQAAEHMMKMGYENIRPEQFYTSAMAAADEVKRIKNHLNQRGVNYLLNVGPDHLGRIPQPAIEILRKVRS